MLRKTKIRTISIILLIMVIITFSFIRINKYSSNEPIVSKQSVLEKAITNVEMGSIYDKSGTCLLFSKKRGSVGSNLDDATLTSLSNLLGVDPRNEVKSSFTVRNLCSETLYGLKQNGFSKKSLFQTVRKGGDIQLTINSELQKKCYEVLSNHPEYFKNPENAAGCIVVMNYQTGEIYSMTSYPSINLNNTNTYRLISGLVDHDYRNSAASNRNNRKSYMPASLIKPLVFSAALSYDISFKNLTYTCDGKHNILSCGTPHGTINMQEAISKSCNCFTEHLVSKFPSDYLNTYFQNIGFNVDAFPSKQIGGYKGNIDYSSTENQNIYSAIGEGSMSTTPLMIASAYSSIFNEGIMVDPKLVSHESIYHNEEMLPTNPSSFKRVCTADTSKYILEGMQQAALTGTANTLSEIPGTFAAKTGTSENNTVTWCVAAHLENNYLVLVCLEDTTGSGGKTAAPICKEIIAYMEDEIL